MAKTTPATLALDKAQGISAEAAKAYVDAASEAREKPSAATRTAAKAASQSLRAAQYDVVNPECLPPPKDNPGGHTSAVPTHDIPLRLQRVSDNEYVGVVHVDGMVDADYHGRGVCRWKLIQAQVQLQAPGAEGGTRFVAKLNGDEVSQGTAKAIHYWKARYPSEPGADSYRDYGQPDLQKVPADQREEFFDIVLTAGEA